MPCLPPLPLTTSALHSSLFEREVHICVGETNEADRIKDWTEESAELEMIPRTNPHVISLVMCHSPRGKGLPHSHPPTFHREGSIMLSK